jgi:hypothetical protein
MAPARQVYDTGGPALIAGQGQRPDRPQAQADLGAIPACDVVVVLPWSLLDSYAKKRR